MPKKTKETINEKIEVEKETTSKAKVSSAKKTNTKKASTKQATDKKTTTKKSTAKNATDKKATTKKSTVKKTTDKKTTTKKSTVKKTTAKKVTAKKSTAKKESTKNASTKGKKKIKIDLEMDNNTLTTIPMEVEYYDLPYKYNETVVKILYQNPTTLFVYWEVSDNDIENYKNIYGQDFFETTYPILTVYNDTMNYKFEVPINDFANSWYFHINDAKCNYHAELGRRLKYKNAFENDYIYISVSNTIESPNDRVLFSTNENNSVYFKNTKNSSYKKIQLQQLISQLNLTNKKFGFPLIQNLPDLYKHLFDNEDILEFTNISNPSSGSISSRFK